MAFLAQSNIQLGRYILQHCNFSLDLINFLESDGKWRWMNFFGWKIGLDNTPYSLNCVPKTIHLTHQLCCFCFRHQKVDKVLFIRWWAVSTVAVRPTCTRPVRTDFAIFTLALFQSECIFVGRIELNCIGHIWQNLPAFTSCSSNFVLDTSEQQQITSAGQKLTSCDKDIKIMNYPAIRPDNASYPAGYRIVEKSTIRPDNPAG